MSVEPRIIPTQRRNNQWVANETLEDIALRFLPRQKEQDAKWWTALILSGPGWTLFGVIKLLAGSFLAGMALR